jgi:hypothetical protein
MADNLMVDKKENKKDDFIDASKQRAYKQVASALKQSKDSLRFAQSKLSRIDDIDPRPFRKMIQELDDMITELEKKNAKV